MKSKNVSLVLKFIPVRGRKLIGYRDREGTFRLKFIPVRGRKLQIVAYRLNDILL